MRATTRAALENPAPGGSQSSVQRGLFAEWRSDSVNGLLNGAAGLRPRSMGIVLGFWRIGCSRSDVGLAAEGGRARLGCGPLPRMRRAVVHRSPAEARFCRGCADGCIDRSRRGQRWGGNAGSRVHGARARGVKEPIRTRRPVWHRGQRLESCTRRCSGRWSEVGGAG